jgi:hypothetical protein
MIVTPLRFTKTPKPVALVVPAFRRVRIITVDQDHEYKGAERCWKALQGIEGHTIYVERGLRHLVHTTGAQAWTADLWRGRAVSMKLYGTKVKVTSLRGSLSSLSDPAEQFAALLEVSEWLADQGVKSGSLSSMSWNLWRSTLDSPLEMGFDKKVARAAFYGGRKESSRPHSYTDQVSLDISAAYPHAMLSRPYAATLREVATSTRIASDVAGFAKVRVTVPESLPFPTLPVRLAPEMIQWRYGVVEGTYPWSEIAAAESLGCEVEVLRCWAPLEEVSPFSRWFDLTTQAREVMSTAPAKMVKALSNLLWSSFAINGEDSSSITWADDYGDEPTRVANPPRRMAQDNTIHFAAETSARVRVRMLLEGLYGDTEPPCHVDTDGMIVSRASLERRGVGEGVGSWRAKQEMSVCEIKAPQMYRYQCGPRCGKDHSLWHYVAAGTPSKYAAELFESHPGFQISLPGLDTVVSTSSYLGEDQVKKYLEASEILDLAAHGPRLDSVK